MPGIFNIYKNLAKMRHNNLLVLLNDLFVSILASCIALFFIRWQNHATPNFEIFFLFWTSLSLIASLVSFLVFRLHKMVIYHASMRLIASILLATSIKEILLLPALFANKFLSCQFAPSLLLYFCDYAITVLLLTIIRLVIIDLISISGKDLDENIDKLSVMVYGVSDKSVSMVARLGKSKHFNICGFLSRDISRDGQIIADNKVYYFKDEKDLERIKSLVGIESILFSNDADAESEKDGLVTMCLKRGINVLMTPKIESVNYGGMTARTIKGVVDNDFIPDAMNSFERNAKRVSDLLISTILIVLFSPLMLICWIALKIGDHGPAIYSQERIGRFGRPFKIYKFRSMRIDAESGGPALYAGDNDPRLTKVGGFLRRHHLDELPQLFNVFLGDMSFVGYRPERKYFIDKIMEKDPRYYYLYQIRPGVTSYATLHNGYTDSMEKMLRRLEFDLYYLRHRSWLFDLMVICQTFLNVAFGKKF